MINNQSAAMIEAAQVSRLSSQVKAGESVEWNRIDDRSDGGIGGDAGQKPQPSSTGQMYCIASLRRTGINTGQN